jgi:hypothetical protein
MGIAPQIYSNLLILCQLSTRPSTAGSDVRWVIAAAARPHRRPRRSLVNRLLTMPA